MPYRKINEKTKKKSAETRKNQAAHNRKLQPAATSIVSPTGMPQLFGAEGASASMADRAVRAARL
jgi:hypothetical protein